MRPSHWGNNKGIQRESEKDYGSERNAKRKTNFQLYQEGLPLSGLLIGLVWMTGWRKANSDIINHYELKLQ